MTSWSTRARPVVRVALDMAAWAAGDRTVTASDSEQQGFGMRQVVQARAARAAEIFWHPVPEEPANQAGHGPFRVEQHQPPAVTQQMPAERSGEAHEVRGVATPCELHGGAAGLLQVALDEGERTQAL